MYRSTSYASQGSKTVFVEMAERSAETASLLQKAREPQSEGAPIRKRSVARQAVSTADRLLQRLRKLQRQLTVEARG